MKKLYVATATRNYEEAAKVMRLAEKLGWSITFNWTEMIELLRVKEDGSLRSPTLVEEMYAVTRDFNGVTSADALLYLSDPMAKSALTEVGIALGIRIPAVGIRTKTALQLVDGEVANVYTKEPPNWLFGHLLPWFDDVERALTALEKYVDHANESKILEELPLWIWLGHFAIHVSRDLIHDYTDPIEYIFFAGTTAVLTLLTLGDRL